MDDDRGRTTRGGDFSGRPKPADPAKSADPGLLGTIGILWRRRWLVVGVAAGFAVFTMALSLVVPRVYEAQTSLLPPVQESPGLAAMASLEAPLGLLGFQGETVQTARLFEQILKSRTVTERVIRSQSLLEWYKLDDLPEAEAMEQAIAVLRSSCVFFVSNTGVIEISIRYGTPWFASRSEDREVSVKAAGVANALVEELDRVNREKSLSRAKQTRIYLERQLAEGEEVVARLADEMAEFQRSHGAVALPEQTRALVEVAAVLRGTLLSKEVELGIARQTMMPGNPTLRHLESEVEQMRGRLASLEDSGTEGSWMNHPAGEIPALYFRAARFERDLQAQLLVQSYLSQQFHQARIQEARESPTVQVLDPAVPPEARVAPRRKMMAAGGILSGVLTGLLAAALLEMLEKKRRD